MSYPATLFRQKPNLPLILIPLMLLAWAQFGALPLGVGSFHSFTDFASSYTGPLPAGNPGTAIASRVVIIVVDGLRLDASRQMPTLSQMRAKGADRVVQVGQPSLSLPGWTVIGTGAWQEQSGVTSNSYAGAILVDTIFQQAKRKGLTTALVGSPDWGKLYASGVDTLRTVQDPPDAESNPDSIRRNGQEMTSAALEVLKSQPNLLLVHLPGPDYAGHGWGGASKQYADTAQMVDGEIAQLLAAVDLQETAFIVTADHGHTDRGGHAGWEPTVLDVPFVAAGKGIRHGQYPQASQADIAPTLAVLTGAAIPAHNQGEALLDELDAPEALKAARAVDNARQLAIRYDALLQAIGATEKIDRQDLERAEKAILPSLEQPTALVPDSSAAIAAAFQSMQKTHAQWASAVEARLLKERLLRLPLALLILVPFVLYLWWWKRAGWNWRVPVAAALVYFVLWNVNYFLVRGLNLSLSAFNSEEQILDYLSTRVIESMLALIVAMLVVGLLSTRENELQVTRRAVNALFLIALAFATQILVFYVAYDVLFSWHLPDLFWGFKYYLDLFQTTAFYPALYLPVAALLPIVAQVTAWLGQRVGRLAQVLMRRQIVRPSSSQ